MADPLSAGADQVTVKVPSEGTAAIFVGPSGVVAGIPSLRARTLVPALFVAVTVTM